jgi:putative transposase
MPQREHLHRLTQVWLSNPLYFITVCCADRRPVLLSAPSVETLTRSWQASAEVNGWTVGRYVIMPDHVHFFARAQPAGKSLSGFMRDWKRWTANRIIKIDQLKPPLWQPEFFDHVLRSAESYSAKWDYVRHNPVRAGLASSPETWPYSGECESLSF